MAGGAFAEARFARGDIGACEKDGDRLLRRGRLAAGLAGILGDGDQIARLFRRFRLEQDLGEDSDTQREQAGEEDRAGNLVQLKGIHEAKCSCEAPAMTMRTRKRGTECGRRRIAFATPHQAV